MSTDPQEAPSEVGVRGEALRVCVLLNNDYTRDGRVERQVSTLGAAGYAVTLFALHSDALPRAPQGPDGVVVRRVIPERLDEYNALSRRVLRAREAILVSDGRPFAIVHAHDAETLPLAWLLSRRWRAKLVYDAHEFWPAMFAAREQVLRERSKTASFRPRARRPGQLKRARAARKTRKAGRRNRRTDIRRWRKRARRVKRRYLGKHVRRRYAKHWLRPRARVIRLQISRRLERYIAARSDALITVSDAVAELMRPPAPRYRGSAPRCTTLRNLCRYSTAAPSRLIHADFDLPSATRVLIYQGAVKPQRGISELLDAMELLDDDIALLLMGPVSPRRYLKELETRISDVPLRGRVFYKPTVPTNEVLRWTVAADVGVYPLLNSSLNHFHCLPNKLFEYVQAGIPVTVSDLPGMSRVVRAYGLGVTFEPGNPADMASRIKGLLDSPDALEQARANALLAKEDLCWEREEGKLLDLYEFLSADARASRGFG